LDTIAEATSEQTSELEEIRRRAENIAKRLNVQVKPKAKPGSVSSSSFKIRKDEIPSWNDLAKSASEKITEDVVLEDLLPKSEFQYCIEDVKRINDEFSRRTSIWDKRDLSFLAIAIGLQTARWIILQELLGDFDAENRGVRESSQSGDKRKKKQNHDYNEKHKDWENVKSEKSYPTWRDIVFGQYTCVGGGKSSGVCPYDAQTGGPAGFENFGRGSHRANTLGHDPLLGWIFGTANLMTCSISLTKEFGFANYRVEYPGGVFGARYSYAEMFSDVLQSIKEDKNRLAAGLFAQGAHLLSDKYTEKGLPIPLVEVFSEELPGKLYSEQYDQLCLLKDLKKVGAQAGLSILINMVIGIVHKMFYDPDKDGDDKELYECRTRKILLVSNAIASSGNIIYCACSEDWKKLDAGGILVSLYRLFSDVRFITRVKEQFIQSEIDKPLQEALDKLNADFV
jgi:hypothetical protein